MTHASPVPEAQRAPWPAHPAPHEPEPAPDTAAVSGRTLARIGVGAAIGSAAVAAALLYVNHGRKK